MKSIKDKKTIMKRNIKFQKAIASGLVVFSLTGVIWGLSNNNEKRNDISSEGTQASYIADSEEYLFYSGKYSEYLKKNNKEDFDSIFSQIYENARFLFNGNEYKCKAIYIVSYDDGSIHLVDANNNKYDLLTGELISAKRTNIVPFRESSLFYELYLNGIITSSDIQLSNNFKTYIESWDGTKHNQTLDLSAEAYAKDEYQKRFGGK